MSIRKTLVRGTTALALATAIVGASTFAPVAAAAPLDARSAQETVKSTFNKPKDDSDKTVPGRGDLPIGDLPIGDFGSGGIESVPIVGDIANEFKDKEPEEIVTTAVQMAGVATETVVPLIRGFIK